MATDPKTTAPSVVHQTHKILPDFDPPKKNKRNKFSLACATLASMTSVLLGYGNFKFLSTLLFILHSSSSVFLYYHLPISLQISAL